MAYNFGQCGTWNLLDQWISKGYLLLISPLILPDGKDGLALQRPPSSGNKANIRSFMIMYSQFVRGA